MPGFRVMEGFGVAGPANELEATTTSLLSCSAIILFNDAARWLGLFHYPALSLAAPGIKAAIRQMINDVQPTKMLLWKAHVQVAFASEVRDKKQVELDNVLLLAWLKQTKPAACELAMGPDGNFPGVRSAGGVLHFGLAGMALLSEVPGPGTIGASGEETRRQVGNLWFYQGSPAGSGAYAAMVVAKADKLLGMDVM